MGGNGDSVTASFKMAGSSPPLNDAGVLWFHRKYYPLATASGSVSACFGRHLNTGFLAAAASSKRPMRVVCGAFRTSSGSSTASRAIERMASMN
jgi:hypothetical protein